MSRIPFLAVVAAVVALSFLWLVVRGRPLRGGEGVEPVLYASGLHQPRGLSFGPDGVLYVAEAGWSGPGQATVPGRVSAVGGRDQTEVRLDGLPAAGAAQPLFAQSGPGALAADPAGTLLFLGPEDARPQGGLLRLPATGGAADPLALTPDGPGGAAPAAAVWGAALDPAGAGSAPAGAAARTLSAVLPLANLLVRVDPATGRAVPVTPFIAAGGSNPLPTSVARHPDGTLVVTHFGAEPFPAAGQSPTGRVVQVAPDGRWQPVYEGLRFPIAAAFAPNGLLYVVEFASGYDAANRRFLPGSGRVLALGPEARQRRTVIRDVDYPTAIAFSPAGDLYVTEGGVFRGPGEGRLLFVPAQTLLVAR
ncbi:MAG TPA: ScyD/ScyE family protein [Chloroflexota bacterium]|nr:ScyD/ScyE family protein [Chloroflexota bacterium]